MIKVTNNVTVRINNKTWHIKFNDERLEVEHRRPIRRCNAWGYGSYGYASSFMCTPSGAKKYAAYKAYVMNKPAKHIPLLVDAIIDTHAIGNGLVKNLILGVKRFMELKNADK